MQVRQLSQRQVLVADQASPLLQVSEPVIFHEVASPPLFRGFVNLK